MYANAGGLRILSKQAKKQEEMLFFPTGVW